MADWELDGPPWMTYVDPDEAYLRGQAGSVGSGLLGGWGQATLGGSFDVRQGTEAEVRRTIAELAKSRAQRPVESTPGEHTPVPHAG